jgi:hypothetical protein
MQKLSAKNRARGALAGALICATVRAAVTAGFVYCVSHWGGGWWKGADGPGVYGLALVSGLIGLGIGAPAGATCRTLLGALIGGTLSAASCFGLFVIPTELMIGMSHPGGLDRVETGEVLAGLAVMTIAGVVSGGLGAAIGARSTRCASRDP